MDIRKLSTRKQIDTEEEEEKQPAEKKPKRTRIRSKPEKTPSPLSGFLAVVVLVGIGVLFFFSTFSPDPQVRGVQTTREQETLEKEASQAATAIRGRLEERLESVKERVDSLSAEDVVADSPQVDKIIHDLESLRGLPQRQVKQACEAICESL